MHGMMSPSMLTEPRLSTGQLGAPKYVLPIDEDHHFLLDRTGGAVAKVQKSNLDDLLDPIDRQRATGQR